MLGFQAKMANKIPINTEPPTSYVFWVRWTIVKININTAKKPAMFFLNLGIQIRIPEITCKTPMLFQIIGEMLFSKEHGGSKNPRNLSTPTDKNRMLQIPVIMLDIFIVELYKVEFTSF